MNLEIELEGDLATSECDLVMKVITQTAEKVNSILPLETVRFLVRLNDSEVIPEFGVGGYCSDATQIELALSPGRAQDWAQHLPRTIAHEFHHLARWRGCGYGTSLSEVVISEGLAQHFEIEVFPGPPTFYSEFLKEEQRRLIFSKFVDEYHSTEYDHSRWFFGGGEFPFQAGYDLSFHLVGRYLTANHSVPSGEVNLDPKKFSQWLPGIL